MSSTGGPSLCVALTIDVDPDANRAVPGRVDAVSPGGPPGKARYDACFQGLRMLIDLLGEQSLHATFFWEGRALRQLAEADGALAASIAGQGAFEHGCHGDRHEDFPGDRSGLPLGRAEARQAIERAGRTLQDVLGTRARGFRAPYCRLTDEVLAALADLGYVYDASLTREPSPEWPMRPYRVGTGGRVWELALCRCRDARGRPMSGYLWQLLEGRREPGEYVALVERLREAFGGGLLQIALHPWHLVVDQAGAMLAGTAGRRSRERVRDVLTGIASLEAVRLVTVGGYLASVCGRDDTH